MLKRKMEKMAHIILAITALRLTVVTSKIHDSSLCIYQAPLGSPELATARRKAGYTIHTSELGNIH